jgi:hypothetical protein
MDTILLVDWHLILFEVKIGDALPEDANQEVVGELVLVGEAGTRDGFKSAQEGLVGLVALKRRSDSYCSSKSVFWAATRSVTGLTSSAKTQPAIATKKNRLW